MSNGTETARRQPTLTIDVVTWMGLTGMGRSATYEAIRRGEIPHVRIGRKIMIKRSAVERMFGSDD